MKDTDNNYIKLLEITKQTLKDLRLKMSRLYPLDEGNITLISDILVNKILEAGFVLENSVKFCPTCNKDWKTGREQDCEDEFHALENKGE